MRSVYHWPEGGYNFSMPAMLARIRREIRSAADPAKARILAGFFKTGKGEYGEGDRFLGLTVPVSRAIARRNEGLPLVDVKRLLVSPWHEERLIALLLLIHDFERGDARTQHDTYRLYLAHTDRINNWDLVDLSAHRIVGAYLVRRDRTILRRLARSRSLWERRIAVVSTFRFIADRDPGDSLALAAMLLDDPEDLMHKAVGWMLREVGKKDIRALERFLVRHGRRMPRTMLRYAIERFPERRRKEYLRRTRRKESRPVA